MVDLPSTPNVVPQVRAPESRVTPADIAQPYQEMAQNLDKAAGVLNTASVAIAKNAGLKAVTRDADGNVQIENPPLIGDSAIAFHQAVKVAAVADGEGVLKRDDIALRTEHRDDPDGYVTAAEAYKKEKVAQYTKAAGADVGITLGKIIDGQTTLTYRGLLNEHEKLTMQRADASIQTGITSATDDLTAMARGGVTSGQAWDAAKDKITALTQQRVNNPRLAYPPEQAQFDLDHIDSTVKANGFLYHIDQVYKDQDPEKGGARGALEQAKSILSDRSIKLSEPQREQFYHKAVGEIRANEAIRKQDIGEARASFNELTLASAAGARIEPFQVEQVAGAFRAAGDPGGAARVYSSFIRKPLNDDFGRQPLAMQTEQLAALQGAGVVNKSIPVEGRQLLDFIARGESRGRYDVRYGGNGDKTFSGFADHPRIAEPITSGPDVGKTSSAAGRYQFIAPTWDQQKGKLGLKDFSPANQDTAAWDLAQTEYKAKTGRDLLTVLKSGDQAAISDVPRQLSGQWSSLPGGRQPAPSSSFGPAGSAWIAANRASTMDDTATAQWKTVMTDYTREGTRPSLKQVNDIVLAARATGNSALLDTIGADAQRMDLSGEFSHLPLPEQHAAITSMQAAGERGDLAPAQSALMKDLQKRNATITKGLDDNPISTTVTNFPDKMKAPPPLDFKDDQALAAGIRTRGGIAQFARQNWDTPPLSALDSAEVGQVQSMLANPDPAVKGKVFNALSALPEDVRNATLEKIGKGRPDLMVSVAAGSMMKGAPDIGSSIIRGQAAIAMKKEFLPTADGEATAFSQKFDALVPASTFGLAARTDASGPYAVAQGMVKARYADLSAQSSDTTGKLDTNRLEQAVNDVTGGVLDHNGGKLIAPARDMPQAKFDQTMAGITDNDLAGVSTLNGEKVDANYLRYHATLESVGDGRYYVKLGKDPLKPVYAYQGAATEAPQKFMLDLRNRPLGTVAPAVAMVQP